MKEINLVYVQVNLTKRQNRPQFRQIHAVMKAKFKSAILSLYIYLNLTYSDQRSDQHIVQINIAFFTAGYCAVYQKFKSRSILFCCCTRRSVCDTYLILFNL